MWLVLGAVLLAGIVLATLVLRPGPAAPAATPSPARPTVATSAGPGLPFTMPGDSRAQGRWEVLTTEWTPEGVLLQVTVSCDARTVTYGFIAFSNATSEVYEPGPTARRPQLQTGTLGPGESITGWLFLPLPQGDATLILTTSAGHQVSALPVDG